MTLLSICSLGALPGGFVPFKRGYIDRGEQMVRGCPSKLTNRIQPHNQGETRNVGEFPLVRLGRPF